MGKRSEVLNLLAQALDYPRADLPAKAAALAGLLEREDAVAAGALARFERFVAGKSLAQMEELYTQSFDMNPGSPLYVGYHLFGETYRRGEMMSALQGAYARHALDTHAELPDHLCQILRWLAHAADDADCAPLMKEYVLPAVQKVADSFRDDANIYNLVIGAAARAVAQTAQTGGPDR